MGILDRLKSSSLAEKRKKLHHLEKMREERKIRLEQTISQSPDIIKVTQAIEENNAGILRLMTINEVLEKSRNTTVEEIVKEFDAQNPDAAEHTMIQKLKKEIENEEYIFTAKRAGKYKWEDVEKELARKLKEIEDSALQKLKI